ncbi:MAG: MBL fold metallo-hydrolase [Clostridiales bacterium]|nr:MBL fold metallo-hydrolase [Clostridiales bacterium]
MRVTVLVENQPIGGIQAAHGLSLYVELPGRRLLFDVGPDETLFANAQALGVDLAAVDTVIISHGHYDHGGALETFLQLNHQAKVYIQRQAFQLHESRTLPPYRNIGLNPSLMTHPQVTLLDGDHTIDDTLSLFTVPDASLCPSTANSNLYENGAPDRFLHEQNLLIRGDTPVLLMGCSHTGVVNILRAAPTLPNVCIGGLHLYSPARNETVPTSLMDEIAAHLAAYPEMRIYTGHCTGIDACEYLSRKLPHLRYLHGGESLTL